MSHSGPPPPPPPPHGSNPRSSNTNNGNGSGSGLPPGNYDIFIIPPHSSGSGFLYLPSLQPNRNSFLAGVACTLLAVGIWQIISPVLRHWLSTVVASGGAGVVLLILGVGVAGWAWGRTQTEGFGGGGMGGSGGGTAGNGTKFGAGTDPGNASGTGTGHGGPMPNGNSGAHYQRSPPKPSWQGGTQNGASAAWEKAREETRRREEDRKRAEELKKKHEEAARKKEETERAARAAAEKEKWEQMRAREKEAREREARERLAREKLEKDRKDAAGKARTAAATMAAAQAAKDTEKLGVGERTDPYAGSTTGRPAYQKPSARSFAGTEGDEHSFRPYDGPPKRAPKATSASSYVSEAPSFYSTAKSQSTARTTPPPSTRGPYNTTDPDKIVIKGVYLFTTGFPKPTAQLISGVGHVTDGLILRLTTEGCFVDDDIRGVGQREWDVKAWGMKLVETGTNGGTHVLRASMRDGEGRKYVFVLSETEAWKVAVGLQRLRRGTQVRSLGQSGISAGETQKLLTMLGW